MDTHKPLDIKYLLNSTIDKETPDFSSKKNTSRLVFVPFVTKYIFGIL